MNKETKFLIARTAALEKLIELLYVAEFERSDHPIANAVDFGERLRESEGRHRDDRLPQDIEVVMSEALSMLIDRVVENLKRRGHQQ